MTALTDRYVAAVLRAVPGSQRADLEPEVRALVADAIEARAAQGEPDDAAERVALLELGDPSLLAARYSEGPQYLIGPNVFPEWRRLVTLLVSILVPLIAILAFTATLIGGGTIGGAIASGIGSSFMVAIQTVFWITLVMAIIERTAGSTVGPKAWSPDSLPELPDDGRISVVEIGMTMVFNVLVIAGLLWVQLQPPIVVDGAPYPLFDPALWSFWLPWFLVVTVLELVFTVVLYLRGRWTYAFAGINALLGAAFAIPAVYLLQNAMLFNPELVAAILARTPGNWLPITTLITSIAVVVIVGWDAVDGFLKARRAATAAAATPGRAGSRS
jgi:hypothetical protein